MIPVSIQYITRIDARSQPRNSTPINGTRLPAPTAMSDEEPTIPTSLQGEHTFTIARDFSASGR